MKLWTTTISDEGWVPQVVAAYTATIAPGIEDSSLTLATDLPEDVVDQALETPPDWSLEEWPSLTADSDQVRTYLALLKLKALLDFDAGFDNGSAAQIYDQIQARFPDALAAGSASGSYRVVVLEAAIRTTGRADWACTVPEDGELPPGIKNDSMDSSTDLKLYVQNLARYDVARRLESVAPPA
jgi:hypothetical protein